MNKYLTHFMFLLLLVSGMTPLLAQNGQNLEAIRVGYITRALDLTTEEAQRFWPVYNAYQDEMKAMRDAQKDRWRSADMDIDQMGDKEVSAAVNDYVAMKTQEAELVNKYHAEFTRILPMRKVAKLYKAESDFTRLLLSRLQERQQQNRRGNMAPRRRY